MDYNELIDKLKDMESATVECKSGFGIDPFGKTIASFSTFRGGIIFLGVDNDRNPHGVVYTQGLKDSICQVAKQCYPSVNIEIKTVKHDSKKEIVCVVIPKGDGSIYSYKNIAYERRQGTNYALSPEEIVELNKNRKKISYDGMPARTSDRPALFSDVDIGTVTDYINTYKNGVGDGFELKKFLINNELAINGSGKVKNSAILLFGKNPSQFIPHNKINITIFSGTDVTKEFLKTTVAGSLEKVFKKSFIEIMRNTRKYSHVIGSERIDISEYPEEAIREALINAIVHRDYFDETEIFIKIFTDRIEITNPGGFPFGGCSWNEIEKSGISLRRNPIIARFFEKMNLMEEDGQGIPRIKRELREHGLVEPLIEPTSKIFKITLFGPSGDIYQIINSPNRIVLDSKNLNDRQKKILSELDTRKNINKKECLDIFLDISDRTIRRDLNGLVNEGFVKKEGSGSGIRYSKV